MNLNDLYQFPLRLATIGNQGAYVKALIIFDSQYV